VRFSSTFHFEGEQGARDRTNTFRLSLSWRIGKVHEGSHPASQLHDSRARCCETVLPNPAISPTPSTIGHQVAPAPPRLRRHRRRVAARAPARLTAMFGGRSVPLRAHAAQRSRAPPLDPSPGANRDRRPIAMFSPGADSPAARPAARPEVREFSGCGRPGRHQTSVHCASQHFAPPVALLRLRDSTTLRPAPAPRRCCPPSPFRPKGEIPVNRGAGPPNPIKVQSDALRPGVPVASARRSCPTLSRPAHRPPPPLRATEPVSAENCCSWRAPLCMYMY